jgi:hypothetical protein
MMPTGLEQLHPGGMLDNSPTLQRWVGATGDPSPEGTVDDGGLSRPSGTYTRNTHAA